MESMGPASRNTPYIWKGFSYHDKEYETISDFNKDVLENTKSNDQIENLESEVSSKSAWEVEVSYSDQTITPYKSKKPTDLPYSFARTYNYHIVNKKSWKEAASFTRKEEGLLKEPTKLRYVSGLYSLRFIDEENSVKLEAKFGGVDGRTETILLTEN